MSVPLQFCTFSLEGGLYGIPIEFVQEVLRRQPITRVRSGSSAALGLMNLRGRVVSVVDLRECLGMSARPAGAEMSNIVVRYAGRPVSLCVDEIGEVVVAHARDFESDGNSRDRPGHEGIRQAYKLTDRLLLVLDLPEILQGVMT